jgi:hypothetical protein
VSATASHTNGSTGRFRITHPFHPLAGNEYELIYRHHNWGVDRVFFYDPNGRLKSFPVNVTDMFPMDVFTQISAGRSAFRMDDLLELRELLDRHGEALGVDKDV